jgi:hypothetical protein
MQLNHVYYNKFKTLSPQGKYLTGVSLHPEGYELKIFLSDKNSSLIGWFQLAEFMTQSAQDKSHNDFWVQSS